MAATMYEAALAYREAGLGFFPTREKLPDFGLLPTYPDKDGKPKPTWSDYQSRQPTLEEIEYWYKDGRATELAFVCGPGSSGNHAGAGLFVIDVDNPSIVDAYRELCGEAWGQVLIEKTRRGGLHLAMICDVAESLRNMKLAMRPNPKFISRKETPTEKKYLCDIETRGDGGYVCASPSPNYTMIQGDYREVPLVSFDDVVAPLIEAARKLSQVNINPSQLLAERANKHSDEDVDVGTSVITEYRNRYSIVDTLTRYGYTHFRGSRWKRPGGASGSVLVEEGNEIAVFFSSSDLMGQVQGGGSKDWPVHDSFSMFTHYDHDGDIKAAIKAAAEELGIAYRMGTSDSRQLQQATDEIQYRKGEDGNQTIMLVDDRQSAEILAMQGVATLYIPDHTRALGTWCKLALSYPKRYAWFGNSTGAKELLAMAAESLVLPCQWNAAQLLKRREGDIDVFQMDVFNYVQSAVAPRFEAQARKRS